MTRVHPPLDPPLSVYEDVFETWPNFCQIFRACYLYGRGSVFLCRRRCDVYTSGFMDDVMFSNREPSMHVDAVAATPLQRCVHAPATW